MAMESAQLPESSAVPSNHDCFHNSSVLDHEGGTLVMDFDSYCHDVEDRFIISGIVSELVVKGVAEEAAELLAAKELQVNGLKEQLLEGQMVQQFREELEVVVMQNAIHKFREECERKLLDSQFCGDKITEKESVAVVSSICEDLDTVLQSLSRLEQLSTHGSLESDHFHRKVLANNVLQSSSLWEANGRDEESSVNLPENFESSGLKHMPTSGLYLHLRDVIIKLKRGHESTIQAMTEEYFVLKREFLKERELLKERGSFLPLKSKDIDVLRKQIPDVISKLNKIVLQNEGCSKTLNHSRDEYNSLVMENHCLRDTLDNRKGDVKCLSSQVSEAEEKLARQLLHEACMSQKVENLEKYLEDTRMEASVSDELYKCIIRDMAQQFKIYKEEHNGRSVMQDIFTNSCGDAVCATEVEVRGECGQISNMQTTTALEISGIIYNEILADMELQLKTMKEKYSEQCVVNISLESRTSDLEKSLSMMVEDKHKLNKNILEREAMLEEKARLLSTKIEQSDKDLSRCMDCIAECEAVIHRKDKELENLKAMREESLLQIGLCKGEIDALAEKLERAELETRTAIIEERKKADLLIDMKGIEYKEQVKLVLNVVQELAKRFADFELEAVQSIKSNNLRLENLTFQLGTLIRKANLMRKTELLCKRRLERKSSDLQKAEAEVDLLGDEVDTLLGLLEKLYIALDHYSPILQHYPGIMEVLKLVQRELSGWSAKSVCRTP